MVTIVMTYFNRLEQLKKTLESLKSNIPFDVIIVDDKSDQPLKLKEYDFPVQIIRVEKKQWTNPEPALNLGLKKATGNVVIIQNAECYHVGEIIKQASEIKEGEYISFGCFSINKDTINVELNQKGASKDGENAWYNHPVYRPVAYDFCSAIRKQDLLKLNGFDERLSNGWGYGDDYFLYRIRLLGLNVKITEYPYVVHQWHYSEQYDRSALISRNKIYFEKLKSLNEIKAMHIYTEDL